MVINTTTWRPDTCSCIIDYDWDSELDGKTREHILSKIIKCSEHSHLEDERAYYTVLNENQRKNLAYQHSINNGPPELYDAVTTTDDSGITETRKHLKPSVEFNYNWEGKAPDRVLNINFKNVSLTSNHKNTIQTFLDNEFKRKVLIE